MNYRKLFKFAVSVGELMLVNGAETYRVEDTINRILETSNLTTVDSIVMPTAIFATLDDDTIQSISFVKRVHRRGVHLNKVALANDLSRQFCSGNLTLNEAFQLLNEIEQQRAYPKLIDIVSKGVIGGSFAFLFGATFWNIPAAFFVGVILGITQQLLNKVTRLSLVISMLGGVVIAFFSIIITYYLPSNFDFDFDLIIVGSMMSLVPGVAITNAIRDTIQGDYLSGLSRTADAFIVAAAIAVGVGSVLKVFYLLTGV
jgi:uncharacterized membrane protein YjjP (DUF1212 family)